MISLELRFQNLGTCTKLIAQFINKLPFLLSLDAYNRFKIYNLNYQEFHKDITKLTSNVEVINTAHADVQEVLQNAITNFQDISLQKDFKFCKDLHAELFIIKDKLLYGKKKQELDQKLKDIIEKIHALTIEQLSKFLSPQLIKIIRTQRIIKVYQIWNDVLQQANLKLNSNNFETSYNIQKLLTYDKKAILNNLFSSQNVPQIIHSITKTLMEYSGQEKEQIVCLTSIKQTVKTKVNALEVKLKSRQTYMQSIIANTILGINKQPEYQLGAMSSTLNIEIWDKLPNLPIVGVKLPPEMNDRLTKSIGVAFLGITLYCANKIGYYYHLISFFNRIILSQVNFIIKLGSYFNFDELSYIEKEKTINFIAGLFVQLGFSMGYNVTPLLSSYICASLTADLISNLVAKYGKKLNMSKNSIATLQTIIHMATFCYIYSCTYTFMFTLAQTPDKSEEEQAFEVFGLGQDVGFKEVHKRFKELTKQYHPDVCKTNCEEARKYMEKGNAAMRC